MIKKTYNPSEVEGRIYELWEKAQAFSFNKNDIDSSNNDKYCIVIPPPNVTGSLHIGHALNNSLQDVMIRYERMRGKDVLWQTGVDHAGIATQMVVERELAKNNEPSRVELGRDEFLKKVWSWKEQSGGTILKQLKKLGASCDWERGRFTMDDGLSEAVLKVFVELYKEGLIYKDKRLVNWDPKLHTAISDLEVEQTEVQGNYWHINYPLVDDESIKITVATTRPETMLGDTAVAVHPDDKRYKDLIGKFCLLPLTGRQIPIIADLHADPEQGSGAVKITPAHDYNDFEVGKRHNLEVINIFDKDAKLNENVPKKYQGLDRYVAREEVLKDLDAIDLRVKTDEITHTVPYGDRSHVVIEPWLTDQWYCDAKTLAQKPIEAVKKGDCRFVPKNYEKIFFEWMNNIEPWCISRQLWWGHQIPAWYGPDGEIFVEHTEQAAQKAANVHYGKHVEIERDPDVLDTWFSSALWPFSTLGWPDEDDDLKRFYPNNLLITGHDIIFFWVARMMMFGMKFMDEIPFPDVYLHGLVRDEHGKKMSKTVGNVIDPLDLVEKYGADALRFTLMALAVQGRDIKISEKRIEGYRNFVTKIWNSARFLELNQCSYSKDFDTSKVKNKLNKWILGELESLNKNIDEALKAYRFNDAAQVLYKFVWNVFCDWYLEMSKPMLNSDTKEVKTETRAVFSYVFDNILIMAHPFMPFVTEELWGLFSGYNARENISSSELLIKSNWPKLNKLYDEQIIFEINWLIELIGAVRSVRAEVGIPAGAKVDIIITGLSAENVGRLNEFKDQIHNMARINVVIISDEAVKGAVQVIFNEAVIFIPLKGVIDVEAEQARLKQEICKFENLLDAVENKLNNSKFIEKAPKKVVDGQLQRKQDNIDKLEALNRALRRIEEVVL